MEADISADKTRNIQILFRDFVFGITYYNLGLNVLDIEA